MKKNHWNRIHLSQQHELSMCDVIRTEVTPKNFTHTLQFFFSLTESTVTIL